MCLLLEDKYSNDIAILENNLNSCTMKTMINELVLDLISTIKEDDAPKPDMNNKSTFEFYFQFHNKEYKYIRHNNILVWNILILLWKSYISSDKDYIVY